ncbi:extracellular solute-binding protein [Paenibacillus sp. J2TS4]|uniref:extracellular solute-binding protein n=1 Tax=Paenibacillus sp. J2TS4 TaxID=2807194 RepID=UPI001B15F1FA|nr:extracellular solute-binding protein [Paenibacillus sp. J2TS4]GIP31645.1 hypothetical protein J2TS4_08550 [Paenibacillus sp. J2TS4]
MKRVSPRLNVSMLLIIALLVSACSINSGQQNDSAGSPGSSDNQASTSETADPFGKYDPPIVVSAVRAIDEAVKYPSGDSLDNNVWTREFADKLGIKIKYDWTVASTQYEQKLNVSLTSGEMADIMPVYSKQLQELAEFDKLEDLTELFDKYASPLTKEILYQDGGTAMKSATFNDKLLALPYTGASFGQVLWVRSDWLEEMNLPEPKTMDDVLMISKAFKSRSNNSYGLAANWGTALTGFFNGYHAYPNIWIKDSDGKLAFGSIQPEMKAALAKLRELYANGEIDQEFALKDDNKMLDTVTSGSVGMIYGPDWYPFWPFADAKLKDPKIDWKAFPIPYIDENPAKVPVTFPVGIYFVVKKGAKHPEAAIKMLNLFIENTWSKTADTEKFLIAPDGIELFKYPLIQAWPANKDLPDLYNAIKDALQTKDASALNGEQRTKHDRIVQFQSTGELGTNAINWATARQMAPEKGSSFSVLAYYRDKGLVLTDEMYGPPTPTMTKSMTTLLDLQKQAFTRIVMGTAPLDSFDSFVEEWKKLGGDKITKEVNEWAASQ